MKKTTRILAIIVALIFTVGMCAGLVACNNASADFTVGICQLVQHEALDAATQGFMEELESELAKAGKTVEFDLQNASGDATLCPTIVQSFVAKKVDLIMANATPALQAAVNSTDTIPVLGTSITEYGVALDITVGTDGLLNLGNVSGTSDLAPLEEQALMFDELLPNADKIGLLYCSSEANSKYQVEVVEAKLQSMGKTTQRFAFTDSNDIASVLNGAIAWADALYIPTDNTAASNASLINDLCLDAMLPIIAGEENLCKGCGIATMSISYDGIGRETARMAAQILLGTADINDLPIAYDTNPVKKFNAELCELFGITPPQGYVAIA